MRYYIGARNNARTGALATLDCRSARAHTVTGVSLVPVNAEPRRPAAAARRATLADLATQARIGVLPGTPPGFDAVGASDAQLARLNYPRRPDQKLYPAAYLVWRKLVTTRGAYVPPGSVADPSVHGPARAVTPRSRRVAISDATSFGSATSQNWSGSVISGQPLPFIETFGQWNVPAVSTAGNDGSGYSANWVGTDGWGSSDVVQDGTTEYAWQWWIFGGQSYWAWYEFYPDYSHAMSNLSISPGDDVFAIAFAFFDGSGGVWGEYEVYDNTTGLGSAASELEPAGTFYTGTSAEWIEERPLAGPTFGPLPDYGDLQMTSTGATTSDDNTYFADGSNTFNANDMQTNIIMTSDGSWTGDWLSLGYAAGPDEVAFDWLRWL